jgi:DNA-binding response OmpR family regulator
VCRRCPCVAEREFYAHALETEFNILTAGRGSDGVTLALNERPDLVLLDVAMPGIDGWTHLHIHQEPSRYR